MRGAGIAALLAFALLVHPATAKDVQRVEALGAAGLDRDAAWTTPPRDAALREALFEAVSEVARCCPINISVVSRHLSTLRDAGILTSEKRGKEVRYSVVVSALVERLRAIADALEGCCPAEERSR